MLPPDDKCQWAVNLLRVFDKYPALGAVGLNIAQIKAQSGGASQEGPDTDFRRRADLGSMAFQDPDLQQPMQFVLRADFSPFAMRRDAYLDVGGLDEAFGRRGECECHSLLCRGRGAHLPGALWTVGFPQNPLACPLRLHY